VRTRLALLSLVAALALPQAAVAGAGHAELFASPSPSDENSDCPQEDPCSIQHAFTRLGIADSVTINLEPGDYAVTNTLVGNSGTYVTGPDSAHRPRVTGPTAGGGPVFTFAGQNSGIEDLVLVGSGGNGGVKNPGAVRNSRIEGADVGVDVDQGDINGVIEDSVITGFAVYGLSMAITPNGLIIRGIDINRSSIASSEPGSTAIAVAGSSASQAAYLGLYQTSVRGAFRDIGAAGTTNSHTALYFRYSAFREDKVARNNADFVTDLDNVRSEPLFANLAAGDLHEAAGSPTIDAGDPAFAGPDTDFDGAPRVQGTGVDIGAYETSNPAKTTPFTPVAGGVVPPSNAFGFGKQTNRADGSVDLTVVVPGPGIVKVGDASNASVSAAAKKKRKKKRRKPALVKPAKATAKKAGRVKIHLKPTKTAKRRLRRKRSLKAKVKVTFTPTGGKGASHRKTIKFKRAQKKHKRR
jgi:hypothetical protein